jgi:Protein of unknown function (DUF456)
MSELNLVLTICGGLLIISGFLSLIYQFFSSSSLTIAGIICLNIAWHWFHWNWLIVFGILWLVAILSGFVMTAKGSKDTLEKNSWMPIVGSLLGAIFIPIPFLGALIGVFIGALAALCVDGFGNSISQEKLQLALSITFDSFLGLVIEVGAVLSMLILTLFLALF